MAYRLLDKLPEKPVQLPEEGNYRLLDSLPSQNTQESLPGTALRTGARTLARSAEAIAGLPGDIAGGVLGLTNLGISKATGKESPLPSRLPIPTSEDIRKHVTKRATGEYLEPQGQAESVYDDIISDAATLFLPLKGKVPFKKAALGALGKSVAGNTAQWAAESATDSKLAGIGAKIGGIALAGTVGGRKELNKIKNASYKEAAENIPQGIKNRYINIKPEYKHIDGVFDKIIKSDSADSQFFKDRRSGLKDILQKGTDKTKVDQLIELKQGWNDQARSAKLSAKGEKVFDEAIGLLNKTIGKYGKTNKAFYEPYLRGEELTAALNSQNRVLKVLNSIPHFQDNIKNPVVKSLIYYGAYTGAHKVGFGKAATGLGGAYALQKGAQAYELLSKSPVARKYYANMVKAALKNDTATAAKNAVKLDREADKFEF